MKLRMRKIIIGLQKLAAEVKQMKEKSKSQVSAAVGVAAAAALFTQCELLASQYCFLLMQSPLLLVLLKKKKTLPSVTNLKVNM